MELKEILSKRLETLIERKKDENYQNSIPKQAEGMDIPYPTFVKYIKGKAECPASNIIKIARYYGVSTDYLLGNTDIKHLDIKKQEISKYTGLDETSLDFLAKLLSYKVGDCIHYPAENDKELIGIVTCEYDTPTYIVNLLFYNPKIIGLIQSYLCMLNDENASSYQGDKGSAILFELMLELRKLRDMFQPIYKEGFYKYFNKDGEE